jgi:hypothetical protein
MKLSDTKLQSQISWFPFPAQQSVIAAYDEKRHIRLAAGTRFGKSALCAYLALRELLKDNKRVWIVAPTYDLADKVFKHLTKFIADGFPSLIRGISTRPIPQVETPWGSWVKCKSTENPAGLLGEELDLVIFDEVAKAKRTIWEEYLEDRLTTRRGKSVFISTPWGKNWFFEEFVRAKHDKASAAFQFPSKENPHFPQDEWDRLKVSKRKDIFDQNFRAMFLTGAANFFEGVREVCSGRLKDYEGGHFYTLGVDWAKVRDWTVAVVIDKMTHHVVAFKRFQRIPYPLQEKKIIALSENYHRPEMWMDSTGLGEPIADSLKHSGVNVNDYKLTNKSKLALIEKLSIWIEQKRITYPPVEVLLDELETFGVEYNETSKTEKYGAPAGFHDDCVIALALAVWPLAENPLTKGDLKPLVVKHPRY